MAGWKPSPRPEPVSAKATEDWDPGAYSRFRGLRLRPAIDLLAQVGPLPPGAVVDLGCGDFTVGSKIRPLCGAYVACDVAAPVIAWNQANGKCFATYWSFA